MDDVPLHPAFATTAPGTVTLAPHDLHVWAVPLTGESHRWAHLLSAAEQQRLQDELKNAKYYPVLNIGLTIGF